MIDLETIRTLDPLPEIAARVTVLRASGREWVACCPFHPDRSPSFTIFSGGRRFHCFGCGASGDVFDFVQQAWGLTLPEAARMLSGHDAFAHPARARDGQAGGEFSRTVKRDRRAGALAIWNRAVPAAGTPAEAYLRGRGIDPPYPPALRFAVLACDDQGPLPCLVCAVQHVDGMIAGVQRIWLAPDGRGKAAVERPKRSLGQVKGGAIRLTEPDGSGLLAVCEGPEDGLSLARMLDAPVWVAAGASFLPNMQFPPGMRSIIIGGDNDPAGREAADKAAQAFALRGLTARIVRPLNGFKDFNDELRGVNHG